MKKNIGYKYEFTQSVYGASFLLWEHFTTKKKNVNQ